MHSLTRVEVARRVDLLHVAAYLIDLDLRPGLTQVLTPGPDAAERCDGPGLGGGGLHRRPAACLGRPYPREIMSDDDERHSDAADT
jgi:hypothetical protein